MTICIATICENNSHTIMVSDSMLTSEHLSIQFEHAVPKLIELSRNCVAATAGDALAHTELFLWITEQVNKLKSPTVEEVVGEMKEGYKKIRKRQIVERILDPRGFSDFETFYRMQREIHPEVVLTIQSQIDSYDYGLEILLSGVDQTGAHIYSVIDPGTSVCFDAVGFHAIGSGLPHAIASLIAKDYNQYWSLRDAMLAVYEAKKISEKAPGVGANVTNMSIISVKRVVKFTQDEMKQLDEKEDGEKINELDALLAKYQLPDVKER